MTLAIGKTRCNNLQFDAACIPGVDLRRRTGPPAPPPRSGFCLGSRPSAASVRALATGTTFGWPHGLRNRHRFRSGLTLLELLLVLVVVVAVLALAWPALDRPFANQRLRRAADQVRAAIARARNRALVEGVPYQFRFVPGGSEFQIGAYEPLVETDSPTTAAVPPENATSTSGSYSRGVLPPDVYFATANAAAESTTAETDVHAPQADGWSLPVVLFPDGTGTSATITLANEAGRMIDVYLRGLSGSARASEPYVVADVP